MKRILSIIILLCVASMFSLSVSANIIHQTDSTLTCYSIQPINALYVNEVGTYMSAPTLNFSAYDVGFGGSGDTLTSGQRHQMQLVTYNGIENYGYYEQICYFPIAHNVYYSNGVYRYDDTRYTYFYSDLRNFEKMARPTYTGTCSLYFDSTEGLDSITVNLASLNIECDSLGQNYKPSVNLSLHTYIDSEVPNNFVYLLHSPQYYAMQHLRNEGVPESTINNCVGYSLNDCVEMMNYSDDGVNYVTYGTTFTTDLNYVRNSDVARKIMLGYVNEIPLLPVEEDVWLDKITEGLEEVSIFGINLLQWIYLIFAFSVFRYVVKLLMGG